MILCERRRCDVDQAVDWLSDVESDLGRLTEEVEDGSLDASTDLEAAVEGLMASADALLQAVRERMAQ